MSSQELSQLPSEAPVEKNDMSATIGQVENEEEGPTLEEEVVDFRSRGVPGDLLEKYQIAHGDKKKIEDEIGQQEIEVDQKDDLLISASTAYSDG